MKNNSYPSPTENLLSLSAVHLSKQSRTPSSKQNSFNAWKQADNAQDSQKSPLPDKKIANKAYLELRSTMGPIKKQKVDPYLRTTTSSFSWNTAGGSSAPFRIPNKEEKPQYASDSKKGSSKIQAEVVVQERDSGKNYDNSQINYNTIMQKLDKKQKLIEQLKKLSEVKISETMRSPYEDSRTNKKDVSPKTTHPYTGTSSFTNKYLKDEVKETMTSTPEKARFKKDSSFNYVQEKVPNRTPQKVAFKTPEKVAIKTPQKIAIKKNVEENQFKKNYEGDHTPKANKTEVRLQAEPYMQKKWASKLNMPKTATNFTQYNSNYTNEAISTSPILSSKILNEGYANNLTQKSKELINIDAKSNNGSNVKSTYIDSKTVKDTRTKNTSNNPSKSLCIDDFILQKTLGEGKFGLVYQVIHKQSRAIFALKKISKAVIKSNYMIDQFLQEIKIQHFCNHENILRLYGLFDDKDNIYLILEYMEEGTLFSQLKKSKNKILSETEAAVKLKHVAAGIKYLHEKGIAHRDIKPENIVMSHGVGKLCDFGWAAICTERRKTYCGTFDYVAPEILEGTEYDMSVDLWCLGVLAFELLAGKAPFYHISRKETMKKILNVESTAIEFPAHLSKNAVSFIQNLVKKNPEQRMNGEEMVRHPFLKDINQRQM